ncbi:MAG: hypothetical protein WCS52_02375 [bacterium]
MNWKINGMIFADHDLSNISLELSNMATDRLTFEAPGRSITDSSLFSYDQTVAITRDGKPFFVGRCGRLPVYGDPKQEGHSYEILGPWDQLERLIYMQRWKSGYWAGDVYRSEWNYKSRCVLGQDEEGKAIPIGKIISNVIEYAKSCGVLITSGEITDGPYMAWDEVTDMSCADVIRRLTRWLPGSVGYFDYSTVSPAFHFKVRFEIPPVTLKIESSVESVNLTAVGSRSVPSVVLIYEQTNDVEGATKLSTIKDAYPDGATGREIGAIVQTINLPGWSSSTTVQKQSVHCRFIPPLDYDPIMFQKWFLRHHPEWTIPGSPNVFNILKYRNVTIDSVTRDSDLHFELVEGTLQDWMRKYILNNDGERILNPNNKYSYEDVDDNVMTTISYQVIGEDGSVTREVKGEVVTTQIVATNCPPGTYRNVSSSISAGDEVIKGLAKYIYETLNANHFRGSVSIAEEEVTGSIGLGNRLLITGGKTEWSSMSAVIQRIQSNLDSGITTIQVGPPQHLSANDMIELRRANRSRKNCQDADARITGEMSNNNVELGSAAPKGFGASSPGNWGSFIDLVSAIGASDTSLDIQKTKVHVNMVGSPATQALPFVTIPVVTQVRFYNDKLEIKTKNIKTFPVSDLESDWITIATAEPCN